MKNTLRNIILAGTILGGALVMPGCDIGINHYSGRLPEDVDLSNVTYSEPLESNPNLRYVHIRDEKTGRRKLYTQVIPGKEEENKLYEEKRKEERNQEQAKWITNKIGEAIEYDAKESAKKGEPSLVDTTIVTTEFFDTLLESNTLHKKD